MAKMEISPILDAYEKELIRYLNDQPEISKAVVIAGAQPVADAMRSGLQGLPIDHFKRLKKGEEFICSVTRSAKGPIRQYGYCSCRS